MEIKTMHKKIILDACCGGKMFWFDKNHPSTLYIDIRGAKKGHITQQINHEVTPDIIMDFRDLKFPDNSFKLVIFDPPHLTTLLKTSLMKKKYGCLNAETWQYDLRKGFEECWRVLDTYGTLIFKWSETEIPLQKVLKLFKQKPILGHPTINKTIWCVFFKGEDK
jgi:hypothetical protein